MYFEAVQLHYHIIPVAEYNHTHSKPAKRINFFAGLILATYEPYPPVCLLDDWRNSMRKSHLFEQVVELIFDKLCIEFNRPEWDIKLL